MKTDNKTFLKLRARLGDSLGSGSAVSAGIVYDEVDTNGYPVKATVLGKIVAPYAFYKYASLTDVELPNGLTAIGNDAFTGCTGLTSIELPSGLKSIGTSAFNGCTGLTELNIPDSVDSIGTYFASGCSALVSVHLPVGIETIPKNSFYNCKVLKNVNIPQGVTEIGEDAFNTCRELSSVTLPDGLRVIGAAAFQNVNVYLYSKLVIPASVETIQSGAFRRQGSSSSDPGITITFKGKPTTIATTAFAISVSSGRKVTFNVPWAEGEVANAPWGATSATINYNYIGG